MTYIYQQTLNVMDDSNVLVVGGTGSIGSSVAKSILGSTKARVTIFSRDESKQYKMLNDPIFTQDRVRFLIGNVRDYQSVLKAVHGHDFVVHTAALKHVPICEDNVFETVKTNIIGTENLINAVRQSGGVKRMVTCSTDKACQPTTVMGASKLIQERLIQSTQKGDTSFTCVRLGNLFESRGSVFHLFFKQRESGIVTLTDPEMTRFVTTLDEVVETIMYAMFRASHASVVIRNDKAVKMFDVAHAVAPSAEIKYVGVRKNEKMHEVLFNAYEARRIRVDGEYFVLDNCAEEGLNQVPYEDWSSLDRVVSSAEALAIVERFADRCGYTLDGAKVFGNGNS